MRLFRVDTMPLASAGAHAQHRSLYCNTQCNKDPIKRKKTNNEFVPPDFLKIALGVKSCVPLSARARTQTRSRAHTHTRSLLSCLISLLFICQHTPVCCALMTRRVAVSLVLLDIFGRKRRKQTTQPRRRVISVGGALFLEFTHLFQGLFKLLAECLDVSFIQCTLI